MSHYTWLHNVSTKADCHCCCDANGQWMQVSYVRGSGGVSVNLLGSFPLDLQIVIQHLCSRWIRPSFLSKNRMCHLAWAPSSRVNTTACKQPEEAWVIFEHPFPEDGRFRVTAKNNSTFCNMTFCRFNETMLNHCTGYCFLLFLRYQTYSAKKNDEESV